MLAKCIVVFLFLSMVTEAFVLYPNRHQNEVNTVHSNLLAEDRVCYGTTNGLSLSGDVGYWYEHTARTYRNCTYVEGNLVITYLENQTINYDLGFLQSIRYVSGYVIIALNEYPDVISLPNLEIIRGNHTFSSRGNNYALLVGVNAMSELHLPKLREISRGDVLFTLNPNLCHVREINWDAVVGHNQVTFDAVMPNRCSPCSPECDGRPCWGEGSHLCHTTHENPSCDSQCPHRCFATGSSGCCHQQCAGGCFGSSDTNCKMCKDFRLDNKCVSYCPFENPRTYRLGHQCIRF